MSKKIVVFVLLLFVAPIVATACDQRCNRKTGDCETVGWITYMACETWSGSCIDVPVQCRSGSVAENGVNLIESLLNAQTAEIEGSQMASTAGGDINVCSTALPPTVQ